MEDAAMADVIDLKTYWNRTKPNESISSTAIGEGASQAPLACLDVIQVSEGKVERLSREAKYEWKYIHGVLRPILIQNPRDPIVIPKDGCTLVDCELRPENLGYSAVKGAELFWHDSGRKLADGTYIVISFQKPLFP